jgi:stage IV sporulation protein A
MKLEDINSILEKVLYQFPVKEIGIKLPEWVESLEIEHWLKKNFILAIKNSMKSLGKLRDIKPAVNEYGQYEFIGDIQIDEMRLGEGTAQLTMKTKDGLFYKVLGEVLESNIENEYELLNIMKGLKIAKKEYDKIAEALRDVRETGYGMVSPDVYELKLEEPEILRQGNRFGLKLKASAPSLHFIKTNVEAEVSPIVGTDRQGEELVKSLLEQYDSDPQKLWQANMFGKSLEELVKEGLQNKLFKMPEDIQEKLQKTLQRIINEGNGGLICIIL